MPSIYIVYDGWAYWFDDGVLTSSPVGAIPEAGLPVDPGADEKPWPVYLFNIYASLKLLQPLRRGH